MEDQKKKVNICRVCLDSKSAKCTSLFEIYRDSKVLDHIMWIAQVDIREGDGLPDRICPECLLDLETALNFKQRCETSHIILTSSLSLHETFLNKQEPNIFIKKEEPYLDDIEYIDTQLIGSGELFDVDSDVKFNPQKLNTLERGLRKSRVQDLQLECHDCGEHFKSKCKLRVHWKRVHLAKSLMCPTCKQCFKSFKAYNNHVKRKSKSCTMLIDTKIEGEGKSRIFHCTYCQYKTKRVKDIASHTVTHTGERKFVCDICNKSFGQLNTLYGHKECVHKEYKVERPCHICGRFLKGRNRYYRHMKLHVSTPVQCTECGKTLKNQTILTQHMKRHSGVKSFTCELCAFGAFTIAELSNHKRIKHSNIWFNCDLCEFKAKTKKSITKHISKHGNSDLPCTICGMFFSNDTKLMLHQRNMHFTDKTFYCLFCEKRFIKRDYLRKHVKQRHKDLMPENASEAPKLVQKPQVVTIKLEKPNMEYENDSYKITIETDKFI